MSRARSTLASARHAIDELRDTSAGEQTLIEAVQEEIQHFTTATGIPCHSELEALDLVPREFHEQVLRSISEVLTNIARHAHAKRAWVQITRQENEMLRIEVCDDGIGFVQDTPLPHQTGHYGLVGLRERARLSGGTVQITSTPGGGTTVALHIPTQKEAIQR